MPRLLLLVALLLSPIPLVRADGPKLGEAFKVAVARVASEAEAIERIEDRAAVLAKTGNARALAGDKEGAKVDLHRAALMAREIKDNIARARSYAEIGLGLARAGDAAGARDAFREALQATDSINRVDDRLRELADIALAQVRGGEVPAARETFAEAIRCLEAEARARPAGSSLVGLYRTRLIGKLAEAGLVAEALGMAEQSRFFRRRDQAEMLLRRLEEALEGCGRADCRRIVDWVRRQAAAFNEGAARPAPAPAGGESEARAAVRRKFLGLIAEGEARLGDFGAAIKAAESLRGEAWADSKRLDALIAIAEIRIKAGDRDGARDMLRDTVAGLARPPGPSPGGPGESALLSIAWILARLGDLDGVKKAVAALPGDDAPTAAPARGGEEGEAAEDRAWARVARIKGLALIAVARAVRGDAGGALRDCREATALIKPYKKLPPGRLGLDVVWPNQVWREIAAAQALAGDIAAAVKSAGAADDVVSADVVRRKKEPGKGPIEDGTVEDYQWDEGRSILTTAVHDLVAAGDRAGAVRLLDAAAGRLSWLTVGAVSVGHARAGDISGALSLLDRLPDPNARAETLLDIAEAVAPREAKEKDKNTH
jgi:hypothetical protein